MTHPAWVHNKLWFHVPLICCSSGRRAGQSRSSKESIPVIHRKIFTSSRASQIDFFYLSISPRLPACHYFLPSQSTQHKIVSNLGDPSTPHCKQCGNFHVQSPHKQLQEVGNTSFQKMVQDSQSVFQKP
jgi:hypothetical protein